MDSNECFLDACYTWKWCAMLTRGIPYEDLCFYIVDVRTVFMKADFFAAKISCCTTLHIQSRKTRCSIDKFLSLYLKQVDFIMVFGFSVSRPVARVQN